MNPIEERLRRLDGFQQRHPALAFVVGVVKKYGDDNAGLLAVQLTYAMFMTVFPLLLLVVTIASIILAGDPAARAHVANSAFGQFPIIGQQLAHNVHALHRSSILGLIFGLLGLAYGTTGLAQSGLYAMAQIWNIPGSQRPGFLPRLLRSILFLIVLALGLLLTTGLSSFGTFGKHNVLLGDVGELLAAGLSIGLYLLAFRVLTLRQVSLRTLVPGCVVAGIAWTVLQAVGGYVVGHDLKGASATYGMFGLVIGLIAWISLGVSVTLYSAEMNVVLDRHLWPRSIVQPPLTKADRRSIAAEVLQNQRRPEQDVSTTVWGAPMTQDEYRAAGYRAAPAEPKLSMRVPAERDAPTDSRPGGGDKTEGESAVHEGESAGF